MAVSNYIDSVKPKTLPTTKALGGVSQSDKPKGVVSPINNQSIAIDAKVQSDGNYYVPEASNTKDLKDLHLTNQDIQNKITHLSGGVANSDSFDDSLFNANLFIVVLYQIFANNMELLNINSKEQMASYQLNQTLQKSFQQILDTSAKLNYESYQNQINSAWSTLYKEIPGLVLGIMSSVVEHISSRYNESETVKKLEEQKIPYDEALRTMKETYADYEPTSNSSSSGIFRPKLGGNNNFEDMLAGKCKLISTINGDSTTFEDEYNVMRKKDPLNVNEYINVLESAKEDVSNGAELIRTSNSLSDGEKVLRENYIPVKEKASDALKKVVNTFKTLKETDDKAYETFKQCKVSKGDVHVDDGATITQRQVVIAKITDNNNRVVHHVSLYDDEKFISILGKLHDDEGNFKLFHEDNEGYIYFTDKGVGKDTLSCVYVNQADQTKNYQFDVTNPKLRQLFDLGHNSDAYIIENQQLLRKIYNDDALKDQLFDPETTKKHIAAISKYQSVNKTYEVAKSFVDSIEQIEGDPKNMFGQKTPFTSRVEQIKQYRTRLANGLSIMAKTLYTVGTTSSGMASMAVRQQEGEAQLLTSKARLNEQVMDNITQSLKQVIAQINEQIQSSMDQVISSLQKTLQVAELASSTLR